MFLSASCTIYSISRSCFLPAYLLQPTYFRFSYFYIINDINFSYTSNVYSLNLNLLFTAVKMVDSNKNLVAEKKLKNHQNPELGRF